MKRYILTGLSLLAGLTSCLKDKNIEDQKYGIDGIEDMQLVEFPDTSNVVNLPSSNADTTFRFLAVRLNSAKPAPNDIQVTLIQNNTLVTDEGFTVLPSDRYTSSGLIVTIPKGEREGYASITVKPDNLLDGSYGLGFTISSSSGGQNASANYKRALVVIQTLNQYDGIYQATGLIGGHPSLSGPFNREVDLITSSPNSVQFAQPNRTGLFGVYADATVNADNSVGLTGTNGLYVPAGGVNHYNPVRREFYLRFNWVGSPHREATDTLRFLRPR